MFQGCLLMHLSAKVQAVEIYRCLVLFQKDALAGSLETLKNKGKEYLLHKGFKVDYVEICDAETLSSVHEWDGKQRLVVLIAAYVDEIRLIDNAFLFVSN